MIFDGIRKHTANGFYPIVFRHLKHEQLKTKRFTRKLGDLNERGVVTAARLRGDRTSREKRSAGYEQTQI